MELKSKIDPTTWDFLEKINQTGGEPLYKLPIPQGRSIFENLQSLDSGESLVDIEHHKIPGGPQGNVAIRIIRPKGASSALPVVMYYHGAGWVFGNYQTHGRLVQEIALGAQAAVIFVDYKLAPEAQYPSQIEEIYTATKYIVEHAKQFNLDTSHLVVAGDSVGGNMTAVMTLLAKQRGGPAIDYQILLYPVTDANFMTDSYQEFAEGPWLTKAAMQWFWNQYLPDITKRKEITAAPLQASIEQLKNLPPALIITAEFDVLRDEGEAYAHKLNAAGVPVTSIRHQCTIHDFLMLNALAITPASKNALATINSHLRTLFNNIK